MEETILKALGQYGPMGLIIGFMLWAGYQMFQRIMADSKSREKQLFAEAMAREERILTETRERESRLVAERLASEKQAQENQEKFLGALAEVCKGVEGIQGRVEVVESKVDVIAKDVNFLKGAAKK